MSGELAYIPGKFTESTGILSRFLPPVPQGAVRSWLVDHFQPGSWILDPFGASPSTVLEAAQAGFRVFVTANNPIDRLICELLANPPSETELRAALAELGSAHKGAERLEPHIRGLYKSTCIQCSQPVMVESYVWQRDTRSLILRGFHCQNCGKSGEFQATKEDDEYANQFTNSSQLHRARALERVTPIDDPDRSNVEEALDVYLPRTIYALFSIINKLDSLPQNQLRAITALLISAFDQTNNLWPHPASRTRPRQLTNPVSFHETNVWCALENAVEDWANLASIISNRVVVTTWPNLPGEESGVVLYPGRLRDFIAENPGIEFSAAATVLPRFNQAYWTLSTLWAGWLGGRENAVQFKTVLRRRRYDWNWHIGALEAAQAQLNKLLSPNTPIFSLIGEAGPEFLTAALLSARLAGLELAGIALRGDLSQAQVLWQSQPGKIPAAADKTAPGESPITSDLQGRLRDICIAAGREYLQICGEPSRFSALLAACLAAVIRSDEFPESEHLQASELMVAVNTCVQQALAYANGFIRFSGTPNSLETGWWWIQEQNRQAIQQAQPEYGQIPSTTSLADRTEIEVVRYLSNHPASTPEQIDQAVCKVLTGLLTPELQMIAACLLSYADQDVTDKSLYSLRAVDQPKSRRADLASLTNLLLEFGRKLGYQTAISTDENRRVVWKHIDPSLNLEFFLTASAVIGRYLTNPANPPGNSILVYPGSRAGLISFKLEQNPLLQKLVSLGWRMVKFRHIRRLAENEQMTAAIFVDQLDLDPISNRDQQISLL